MSLPEDQWDTAEYLQKPCPLWMCFLGDFGHKENKANSLDNQVHNDWIFNLPSRGLIQEE